MPVVTHQAVKGSAVCCLIVQQLQSFNLPPVHPSPGSRTHPLLHQCPLAATPERHIARSSRVIKGLQLNVLCQHFLLTLCHSNHWQWFEQVSSSFPILLDGCHSVMTYRLRHEFYIFVCLLCFKVSYLTFSSRLWYHHQIGLPATERSQ